ncbi:hypothetical protein TSUD_217390 [Trifolium subterraneum]|uniref:TF-B3 domain-containing protein n=1 Tax=Trifolium subterraneum TaxID=3900 RepID=A0A2Z6NRZ7_TRISU|nr:hypothetical protein TSUD_217390 [Trifolium subterraneum]
MFRWVLQSFAQPVGKLLGCFRRELGDVLEPYVMLQDPSYNEFKVHVIRNNNQLYFTDGWYALKNFYKFPLGAWVSLGNMNPKLILIRLTTRGGTEVDYPVYDPLISRGWVDLRTIHKLALEDKVRFSVTEPHHNYEVTM